MSVNTTVEGVTALIPHTSQYNSSTVANGDSNMSVAGELAASSLPHVHVVYPLHNNIYSPEVMMSLPPLEKFSRESESEIAEQFTDQIEPFDLIASAYHWDNHMNLVNLTKGSEETVYISSFFFMTENRVLMKVLSVCSGGA